MASVESGGKGLLQFSQVGLNSSISASKKNADGLGPSASKNRLQGLGPNQTRYKLASQVNDGQHQETYDHNPWKYESAHFFLPEINGLATTNARYPQASKRNMIWIRFKPDPGSWKGFRARVHSNKKALRESGEPSKNPAKLIFQI
jgi:hypothetical protein